MAGSSGCGFWSGRVPCRIDSCLSLQEDQEKLFSESDTYHVYNSIPDRPATSAQPDGFYSLQTH
ncbi:unnamed protein product [Coregonus sp. 'balchen']|nr:unnamed protein product [Coregonus sp. 'balchen']